MSAGAQYVERLHVKDPGSIPDSANFMPCWYLSIQPSAAFLKIDKGKKKNIS